MWHDVVPPLNKAAGLILPKFADAYAQHPVIMSGFSLALMVLGVCLLREMTRTRETAADEDRPMVIRR